MSATPGYITFFHQATSTAIAAVAASATSAITNANSWNYLANNNQAVALANTQQQYHNHQHSHDQQQHPKFLNTTNPYVPKVVIGLINSVIAQSYEADLPQQRNLNFFLSYLISQYATVCMLMAIVLNRTMVFATTTRMRNLRDSARNDLNGTNGTVNAHVETGLDDDEDGVWSVRKIAHKLRSLFNKLVKFPKWVKVGLRLVMTAILLKNLQIILIALNCYVPAVNKVLQYFEIFNYTPPPQESQSYLTSIKYDSTKFTKIFGSSVTVGENLNYPHKLFGHIGPSTSFLWPLYLTFCLSQFVETFCSVTSGTQPSVDTSLTLFEHSIAFHEFDNAALLAQKPSPELLFLCLNSVLNHSAIHVLKLLNLQKYRLIVLSALGMSFISYYISVVISGRLQFFPTIVIMSFVPQVGIIMIIIFCALIYLSASILAEGNNNNDNRLTFVNLGLENFNVNLSDDFNSVLVKLSVIALTTATKKSFIKELSFVGLPESSWLDSEIAKIEKVFRKKQQRKALAEINDNSDEANGVDGSIYTKRFISNYNKFFEVPPELIEMLEEEKQNSNGSQNNNYNNNGDDGASTSNGRSGNNTWIISKKMHKFIVLLKFFFKLVYCLTFKRKSIIAKNKSLHRKNELLRASAVRKASARKLNGSNSSQDIDSVATADAVAGETFFDENDFSIDYNKLLEGPVMAEMDDTSDFELDSLPSDFENDDDDDDGEVYEPLEFDSEYESEADGSFNANDNSIVNNTGFTTSVTEMPLSDAGVKRKRGRPPKNAMKSQQSQQQTLDIVNYNQNKSSSLISEVFDPKDIYSLLATRSSTGVLNSRGDSNTDTAKSLTANDDFKKILACHLSNDLQSLAKHEQVVTVSHRRPITRLFFNQNFCNNNGNDEDEDEEYGTASEMLGVRNKGDETVKLIRLIMEKRKNAFVGDIEKQRRKHHHEHDEFDEYGGEDEEEDEEEDDMDFSKQFTCVICQSHPRQIILWPCKCLAICDNCRLSLVLRNFNSCVCCRRSIDGYSKVYMP